MTVRIYSVFEHYAPAVKIDGTVIPVEVEHTRRWNDRGALAVALVRRGYVEQSDGTWEFVAVPQSTMEAKGRPIRDTLEQQAQKRAARGCN